MAFMLPSGSNSTTGSGRSKSMEPRRTRLAFSRSASSSIWSKASGRPGASNSTPLALGEVFGSGCAEGRQDGPKSQLKMLLCDLRERVQAVLHAGVGHAARAADDALGDAVADDLALRVDLHDAAKYKAVFVWQQAAHAAGERVRQHRHGAVREVDAGAAQAGFGVEGVTREYIVADVRDVHLQLGVAVRRVARTSTASSKSRAVSPSMVTMGRRAEVFAGFEVFGSRARRRFRVRGLRPPPAPAQGRCAGCGACG